MPLLRFRKLDNTKKPKYNEPKVWTMTVYYYGSVGHNEDMPPRIVNKMMKLSAEVEFKTCITRWWQGCGDVRRG